MVRTYHGTLDLVSEAALDRLPSLVEQAQAYAELIRGVAPVGDILDLGSGAGLPGIVIASTFPDRRVWLVERRRRRATFLNMVVARLDLEEAVVVEADVTQVRTSDLGLSGVVDGVDGDPAEGGAAHGQAPSASDRGGGIVAVTAQAVASFADVYCLTRHLHSRDVTLISRKGPSGRAEAEALGEITGSAPAVVAEPVPIGGGTLVAIEARGGLPCPRSA